MKNKILKFMLTCIAAISFQTCVNAGELKVYAIKYGISQFPEKFIFLNSKSNKTKNFSWMFYYIEFKDRKILIDTGFNNQKFIKMFSIKNFIDPVKILKDNNITPESITDIIITHAHFDHIENIHRFPNARIIISLEEYNSLFNSRGNLDIKKKLSDKSQLIIFEDNYTLYDFFFIKKIGGHTKGSSVIFFDYNSKRFCLTGDEIYSLGNLTQNIGNGTVVDSAKNLNFINELKNSGDIPLIFHDDKYYDMPKNFIQIIP
jgi:glyoxylase-like metal-dependent hydrolase (beta-lactamase superfamily II)